jgi:PAT family beta-lactamase induction signal transducer AmpG
MNSATSPQAESQTQSRSPWLYVPTAYFAEGLPFTLITSVVATVMYKTLGLPNTMIGLLTILGWPWVVKPFWGPLVDFVGTKRKWILATQLLMAVFLVVAGGVLHLPNFFILSFVIFLIVAVFSATHDIAVDGYYLLALPPDRQAFFVGVRATAYRVAMLIGSGVLVIIAGKIETQTGNVALGWTAVMMTSAAIMGAMFLYHSFVLPYPASDHKVIPQAGAAAFSLWKLLKSYFQQKGILAIVAYILLYRFGESMLTTMAPAFLLDKPTAGGAGISTETLGWVYGTGGVISLLVGGLLGGWLISKYGLRKCIWPMAFAINVPDLNYVYMAASAPSLLTIYILVAIEQFGYGLGFSAYMVFLMYTAKGEFKTSHFALATGLMALGRILPGMLSGYLQNALGYYHFFIAVCLLTIPGMLTIFFLPKEVLEARKE